MNTESNLMWFSYFCLAREKKILKTLAITFHLLKFQLSFPDSKKEHYILSTKALQIKLYPNTKSASLILMELRGINKWQGSLFGFMK